MNDEVATMGDRLTTIYQGGYIPSLAIQLDPEHEWHGWLFFKHPDLQWVSLCKINRIEELEAENEIQKAANEDLRCACLQDDEGWLCDEKAKLASRIAELERLSLEHKALCRHFVVGPIDLAEIVLEYQDSERGDDRDTTPY